MSTEVRTFQPTVLAGTALATPATTALVMPPRLVRRIVVRFPPGPNGQVGVRLASGGVQVVPWVTGTWLIGEDESIEWEPTDTLESGAWQLIAYNAGTNDHTIYLRFELDPFGARVALPASPLVITP